MGSAYLFYSNFSNCYMPIYQLLCMSSQVDMTKCKNITVFLAPSVVSSIVITVIEWTHLKPGETQKVLSLFQLKIAICWKKKLCHYFTTFLYIPNIQKCVSMFEVQLQSDSFLWVSFSTFLYKSTAVIWYCAFVFLSFHCCSRSCRLSFLMMP